jgi:hypothetical protein
METTTSPSIAKELKEKLKENLSLESQVVVHINFTSPGRASWLRIWPSTFLFDNHSPHKSKLIFHHNITLYPSYVLVHPDDSLQFTLIFSALPKSCTAFDLIEQIPEKGGFVFRNIQRNTTDIYDLKLQ